MSKASFLPLKLFHKVGVSWPRCSLWNAGRARGRGDDEGQQDSVMWKSGAQRGDKHSQQRQEAVFLGKWLLVPHIFTECLLDASLVLGLGEKSTRLSDENSQDDATQSEEFGCRPCRD